MRKNDPENIRLLVEKRERRQWLLDQTVKLIDKAEEKRRFDKEHRRKWDRILMRLEDSFVEVKRAVAECDTLIGIHRAKEDQPSEQVPESPKEAQAAERPPAPGTDMGQRAAYKIVSTPVEGLPAISFQDAALARAYMARRTFGVHDREFRKRLTAKLELANQLPRPLDALAEGVERRSQYLLREAIAKAQAGSVREMTDDEIDLVVSCYMILSNKLLPTPDNKRLMEIISKVIETLKAERTRRRLSSR